MRSLPLYSLHVGKQSFGDLREIVVVREYAPTYDAYATITQPEEIASYVYNTLSSTDDVEHMLVIPVNASNIPLGVHVIAKGTVNEVNVSPRDVFRAAIMLNATSLLLAHTHPSGNSTPSEADKQLTTRMVSVGQQLGIQVLDHIVVGMGNPMSYSSIMTKQYNITY